MAGGGAQSVDLSQITKLLQGINQPGSSQATTTQSPMSNYASPNQNPTPYQNQGSSLTQAQQNAIAFNTNPANYGKTIYGGQSQRGYQGPAPQGQQPPIIGATPQNQNFMQGPDTTGNGEGSSSGFFDGSGSDGGQGGQPAPMQAPFGQQGNKPPSMSQFRPQQGLQIQGNPTSQVVQRPQQR